MQESFYPFVDNQGGEPTQNEGGDSALEVRYPARIAVYDDAAAAPRVVVIQPQDVRSYLEEITATVVRLAKEQGGSIPFMVIREVVENFIHAYFIQPTISILDGGDTIRFSDKGPGIREKARALEYGTSSATEEMRKYIRGVGSGLPYAQQYMEDKGGSLTIEDNISGGTVVTISTRSGQEARGGEGPVAQPWQAQPSGQQWPGMAGAQSYAAQTPWQQPPATPYPPVGYPQPGYQAQASWTQQPAAYGQGWQQQVQPAYQMPYQGQAAPAQPYQQQGAQGTMRAPVQQAAQIDAPQMPAVALTDRGWQVLSYLRDHDSVGPTDLARSLGGSQPTWSRELQTLEQDGLLIKRRGEQKRCLTELGKAYLARI
jgi:uncharacterized membrane protein